MRRALLFASFLALQCSKTPNLGPDPVGGSGGTGNAGGTGGTAGTAGIGGFGATGGSAGAGGGGGGGMEMPGATRVTLLHAIADHDVVRFCFLPYPGGDPAKVPTPAWSFGQSQVFDPDELVPAGESLRTVVFAGDLALTQGKTCDEIEALAASLAEPPGGGGAGGGGAGGGGAGGSGGAGPPYEPPLLARSLPVVPASALASGWSLLLAASGCAGPKSDGTQALGCGISYSPATPTLTLIAVKMSRVVAAGKLGFQAVNASVAMMPNDIRLQPNMFAEWQIASMLTLGAIEPDLPMQSLNEATVGDPDLAELRTYIPGTMVQSSVGMLGDALALGGLSAGDLVDGSNYTLVAVGGYPGVGAASFWSKFGFVVLRSDP